MHRVGRHGTKLRFVSSSASRHLGGSVTAVPESAVPPIVQLMPLRLASSCQGRSVRSFATSDTLEKSRTNILQSSLQQVHEHGWTEDAIAAAVMSLKLPPSMIGMVTTADLVQYFMEDCNQRLNQELDEKWIPIWEKEQQQQPETTTTPLAGRIASALQTRLEYVIPYVESRRWHDAMALGSIPPNNASVTVTQLDKMVTLVSDAIVVGTDKPHPLGFLQRAAIGAVYVATELHLLTDKSEGYRDTWAFLDQRVGELEVLAKSTTNLPNSGIGGMMNSDTAVAVTAVAASLGGAVLSLGQPAARGLVSSIASTVVPQLATFMQQPQGETTTTKPDGTRPSDYDASDLPPFPKDGKETTASAKTASL